ncbi:MAG: Isonitrile hydratase (EC [uncultured Caballeronia sp.]|nr:MAG: Isonitrile hydratase (EC [uncultured Caballeronia sp.]
MTLHIGFLVFPRVQQFDLASPHDVFASVPGATVHLIGKTLDSIKASSGLALTPTVTYTDCPALDFIRRQAAQANFVTSVCTGALVLGAAGLLRGRRATTHWAAHHFLESFGAIPVKERVVQDGNLMTGGGVTAGIDFALTLLISLIGEAEAQAIQLQLEYAPAPPFNSGTLDSDGGEGRGRSWNRAEAGRAQRAAIVERAAARLNG